MIPSFVSISHRLCERILLHIWHIWYKICLDRNLVQNYKSYICKIVEVCYILFYFSLVTTERYLLKDKSVFVITAK